MRQKARYAENKFNTGVARSIEKAIRGNSKQETGHQDDQKEIWEPEYAEKQKLNAYFYYGAFLGCTVMLIGNIRRYAPHKDVKSRDKCEKVE